MSGDQQRLTVGKAGRRREGHHEREARRTLAAWSRQAHLVGDENAAVRDVIKAAARNLDRADNDDATSPYARAYIQRQYNDLLVAHQPHPAEQDTSGVDPWTAALDELQQT